MNIKPRRPALTRKPASLPASLAGDLMIGAREVTRQALRVAGAGLRHLGGAARTSFGAGMQRLPSARYLFLIAGSAALSLAAALLVVNLRYAAKVLPEEGVDLVSAGRPVGLTVLDRHGRRIGTRGIEYDGSGQRVTASTISYREPIPLDALPPYVVDAFIATEDRRFFEHPGFDLRGLVRAFLVNVKAGRVVEGGSTITQQLARNLFLENDRTLARKLEELQLALWLEARLTKEEILSLYLNRIYLGAGTYGIEAAADTYFSKDATALTLAEAALIAGLPKSPSALSPTTNLKGALARSSEVIDNLVEAGRVDPMTGLMAKSVPPALDVRERNLAYGYFLDRVTEAVYARFGTLHEDLVVTTTLDLDIQAEAQAAVADVLDAEGQDKGAGQAALIAFDDHGGIVAMVGGRAYQESQFNRASQAERQPGSAFKPFVYLAALEAGFNPGTLAVDAPVRVGEWQPSNYKDIYKGPVRLSEALAISANAVAVQVAETIGRDRVIDAARRAGLDKTMAPLPSIALGAAEMTLEELTAAYMTFAREGGEPAGHVLKTVETRSGTRLYTHQPIEGFEVIEPALARAMTAMLAEVMTNGTGRGGALPGRPSAGKTGTTNEWRDAWFIGFTPQFTAGVWVGNDDARPMNEVTGSGMPLTIWNRFMTEIHADLPVLDLPARENAYAPASQLVGLYQGLRSDLVQAAYLGDGQSRLDLGGYTPVVGRAAPGAAPAGGGM